MALLAKYIVDLVLRYSVFKRRKNALQSGFLLLYWCRRLISEPLRYLPFREAHQKNSLTSRSTS